MQRDVHLSSLLTHTYLIELLLQFLCQRALLIATRVGKPRIIGLALVIPDSKSEAKEEPSAQSMILITISMIYVLKRKTRERESVINVWY